MTKEISLPNSSKIIDLISKYLDLQVRKKCKHKRGDPNHIEAA